MESSSLWIIAILVVIVLVVLAVLVGLRKRRAGRVLIAKPSASARRQAKR